MKKKQGRIHGYLSRVRLGRGSKKSLLASKPQNTRSKIDVNRRTDRLTKFENKRCFTIECTVSVSKKTIFCQIFRINCTVSQKRRFFAEYLGSIAYASSVAEKMDQRLNRNIWQKIDFLLSDTIRSIDIVKQRSFSIYTTCVCDVSKDSRNLSRNNDRFDRVL